MGFDPIDRMWHKVDLAKNDSDTQVFIELMRMGEMITKLVTLGLVATIQEDVERRRYRQLHRLVRADGIGEWAQVIEDLTRGSAAPYLLPDAQQEQIELAQKVAKGNWQHDAVISLSKCFSILGLNELERNEQRKLSARLWFEDFAKLRNKTTVGHGKEPSYLYAAVCKELQEALLSIIENYSLFNRSWAYLHRNFSGKYKVTMIAGDPTPFEPLRQGKSMYLPDGEGISDGEGIYIFVGKPLYVDLIKSNAELSDYSFANGAFSGKSFESVSFTSGERSRIDNTPYMIPTTDLPPSSTEGHKLLEIQESVFSNVPAHPKSYVHRLDLEDQLRKLLTDDRNPVITLLGRGGIGKTSLSLSVLHEISKHNEFEYLLWFSARDIDLLESGPKYVKPEILTEKDIARVFAQLLNSVQKVEDEDHESLFSKALGGKLADGPYLFVFDNFETVRNPVELFNWINEYVRLPNKVLITTRFRQFKGDYPLEVPGMNFSETQKLIQSEALRLQIAGLLSEKEREKLYTDTDGHPYVIKLIMGEIAKSGNSAQLARVIETKDRILEALFERSYENLSPVAQSVFLTLCNWQSAVPLIALEAVLLHSSNESLDVEGAVNELSQSSLVETVKSGADGSWFVTTPLVASSFGRAQVDASFHKNTMQTELRLLQAFGVTRPDDIDAGLAPKIDNFFRYLERIPEDFGKYEDMAKSIARRYSPAWLHIMAMHEKIESARSQRAARNALQQYIQSARDIDNRQWAWRKLADMCARTSDRAGEINALLEGCMIPGTAFRNISYAAGRFLTVFRNYAPFRSEDKRNAIEQLIRVMEERLSEAESDDLGRLVWLCRHNNDLERARKYTRLGLKRSPRNKYLTNLAKQLQI